MLTLTDSMLVFTDCMLAFTDSLWVSRIASCVHGFPFAFTDCLSLSRIVDLLSRGRKRALAHSITRTRGFAVGSGPVPPCRCRGPSTGARDRAGKSSFVFDSRRCPRSLLYCSLRACSWVPASACGDRGLRRSQNSVPCTLFPSSRRVRRPEYDVKLLAGLKALKASPTACWLQGLVPREGNKGWAKHPSRTFAWFLPDQLVVTRSQAYAGSLLAARAGSKRRQQGLGQTPSRTFARFLPDQLVVTRSQARAGSWYCS